MQVGLFTHPVAWRHRGPHGHPERPERLDAVVEGVAASGLEVVRRVPSPLDPELLTTVHDPGYVRDIATLCAAGGGRLDPDTYAVAETWEAARCAAGAGIDAIDLLAGGFPGPAFCAVRPPGHHAERGRAMGFCIFNNVAVAARRLADGGARVAIVDWDVHHGNGTQHTFFADPRVLYVSLHEFPFYPGTGWEDETGTGPGAGFTVNVPLPAGSGGSDYRTAFRRIVLPILTQFGPDWVLVSAGYDAHAADPLADMRLGAHDYRAMAGALGRVIAPNRVVFLLEGGYDLDGLRASTAATLDGLVAGPEAGSLEGEPSAAGAGTIERVVARHARWWELGQA